MSLGRPKKYSFPWTCPHCQKEISNRGDCDYHKKKYKYCPASESYSMSAVEKKIKADVDLTLVPFDPSKGVSAASKSILDKLLQVYDAELDFATRKNRIPHLVHVKDRIIYALENGDYDTSELLRLKNFFTERAFDFVQKQEKVKNELDAMLDECSLIIGNNTFERLIGNPPNYTQSMEKLVVNHIRQRNLQQLESYSEVFIKAVVYAVKETKIFRVAQTQMDKFKMIQECIDELLQDTIGNTTAFARDEGQMTTQDMDFDLGTEAAGDNDSTIVSTFY